MPMKSPLVQRVRNDAGPSLFSLSFTFNWSREDAKQEYKARGSSGSSYTKFSFLNGFLHYCYQYFASHLSCVVLFRSIRPSTTTSSFWRRTPFITPLKLFFSYPSIRGVRRSHCAAIAAASPREPRASFCQSHRHLHQIDPTLSYAYLDVLSEIVPGERKGRIKILRNQVEDGAQVVALFYT